MGYTIHCLVEENTTKFLIMLLYLFKLQEAYLSYFPTTQGAAMLAALPILELIYHPPQNITYIMSRASGWTIWKTNKIGAKEM